MSRQQKNRIRGFILLMVFSLNTIAGFACSIGIDMGYNTKHHEHTSSHSHEKGHAHVATTHPDTDHHSSQSHHSTAGGQHENNDCCANDVTDFIKLEKSVASNNLLLQAPVFMLAFTSAYLLPDALEGNSLTSHQTHYSRRSWRPSDDTNLRIIIQSFQI